MTKLKLRNKALELRRLGKSYSQIKKELGVSKSTLSYWLRNYPLSKNQIRLLRDLSETRIEKYRETMRKKREKRLSECYQRQKRALLPLNRKELYIAGLYLYWGEGVKGIHNTHVGLRNTNPKILKFYLYWLTKVLRVPKEKIRVHLHLYSDMDIQKEIVFWKKVLRLSKKQFNKPYIKASTREKITHKGFGHGTCGLFVYDARLKEKIILGIESMADYYSGKLVN